MKPVCILALCGSLREGSSNLALLQSAKILAPPDVEIIIWNAQAALPHFNPDLELSPPPEVQNFRQLLGRADGLIVACPEYARGVPGSFKNALDWLVGGETFVDKRFAQWNASPRAFEAQRSLRMVLETMSGILVEEGSLSLPLIKQELTPLSIASNLVWAEQIKMGVTRFADVLRQ